MKLSYPKSLVCSLLSLVFLFARPAQAAYETGGVVKTFLSNGVTVLMRKEPDAKIVAIEIFVRIGAADEDASNAGIGQLVAGSILAGTETRSAAKLARLTSEVGGNFHAVWQPNYLEIYAVTLPDMADDAVSLLADSVQNSKFDQSAVDYARAAIAKESKRQADDAFTSAYGALRRLVQHGSVYDRPYLGDPETLKGVTREQLKAFYERNLSADRVVISVVGNVDFEKVSRKIEVCFGRMPRIPARPAKETASVSGREVRIERPGPEAYLMVGYPAPGVESPDYAAMCVANVLLGGNKSSLMFRNLREQRGLAYRIGSTYPVLRGGSHVAAYLGMDSARAAPDALNVARDGILEQVQTLRSGAFTDDDLERAKRYLMGNHALQHQRVRDRALLLGRFEVLGLGYQHDFRFPDRVREVTREKLLDVCTRYLNSPSVVILAPPEEAKP